jgi:outer membrane protein TolC
MNKTMLIMMSAGLIGGCIVSPSPVGRMVPYLEPGTSIAPAAVGKIERVVDLPAEGEITLEKVLAVAFARNPDMAMARSEWGASRSAITGASSLPDPMVRFTHLQEPVQTRTGPQRQRFTIMQKIPFPLTLAARSSLTAERAKADWIRYDRVVRDVIREVKTAYWEVLYLRNALRIVDRTRKLAEELAALAEAGRARDEATLFDAVKARGQTAQLLYDRIVLEELLAVETARLNGLLDRNPEASVGPLQKTGFRPFRSGMEDLYRIAMDHAQELKLADQKIRVRKAEARLRAYSNLPDFEVGFSYNVTDPYPGVTGTGRDSWGISAGMNLPIWLHRNGARIREAERRLDASLHGKRKTIQAVLLRVRTAYQRLVASERLVLLYGDTLLPQAEDAMAKAEAWFRSEGKNFSKFLEAQAVLVNFQLGRLRAEVDFQQALARLEQATGGKVVLGGEERGSGMQDQRE